MKKNINYFIHKYLEKHPAFFSLIRPQEAFLFHENIKYLKSPILDFGSGDGFFAKIVFGQDSIDVGLDLENARNKEAELTGVYRTITYYDGKKIPSQNNYFRTVVSNCVLEHIPAIDYSLAEISRVLKPHGHFITSVMADKWEDYQLGAKIVGKSYQQYMRKKQVHFNLLSKDEWEKKFARAGFKVVKVYGYLSPQNSFYLDLFHYLSLPSLISYKLTGKWVLFPQWYKLLKVDTFIEKIISASLRSKEPSAALFYVLEKEG